MKHLPFLGSLAACIPFAGSLHAQGGPAAPYGCGFAPEDSLVFLGGSLTPGGVAKIGVDNPAGTQGAGALTFLVGALAPDPAYPCGTLIPGFGMTGPAGELLVSLSAPHVIISGAPWLGAGQPAAFDVPLPNSPLLFDAHVFFQGLIIDPVGPVQFGFTGGLDVHIPAGKPDLVVRSAFVEPIPVAPGEVVRLHAVVLNIGGIGVAGAEVEACLGPGPCSTQMLTLAPGGQSELVFAFQTNPSWMPANPSFGEITADPLDLVDELLEANNHKQGSKPAFVVNVAYVPPVAPVEHDESIVLQDGVKVSHTSVVYPQGAPSASFLFQDPAKGVVPEPAPGSVPDQPRISPAVAAADAAAQPGELIEYIVVYDHGVEMPFLPPLPSKAGRFVPANIPAFEARLSRLEATRRLRRAAAEPLVQSLEQAGGAVVEHYTLAGAMLVQAPKGYLAVFDADPAVRHVEQTDSVQPLGTVSVARGLMQTDPYYSGGATGTGYIAVIDSGVRDTHDLLSGTDHLLLVEDCVSGDSYCNDSGSSAYDPDLDEVDHGTPVAAIITGNSAYGSSYRGFSGSWVDSWKAVPTGGSTLSSTAILRAFDQVVTWADHIVNCSFGNDDGPSGSLSTAADDLFSAGCIVVCSNGNTDGYGTVVSPACAHKVLGIGVYDVDTLVDASYQSDGPTSDSRYKPDLQAPTNSITARATSDTALGAFGGTSSGSPCVVGTASVFSDWFGISTVAASHAGKVYAALINGGPRGWGDFDNEHGVGATELPLNGHLYLGSRNVILFENDYVEFDVPAGATRISCALWWAESESSTHGDIDLYLQKPDGSISTSSISKVSVFEHASVTDPIVAGTRKLRLYGYDVPVLTYRTVYYAIHVE